MQVHYNFVQKNKYYYYYSNIIIRCFADHTSHVVGQMVTPVIILTDSKFLAKHIDILPKVNKKIYINYNLLKDLEHIGNNFGLQ